MAHYYVTHGSEHEVIAFFADDEFVKDDIFLGLHFIPFSELK